MIIPDVNVLVGALQPDDPNHSGLLAWLSAALNGRQTVGFSLSILAGTVRVLTNRRIFRNPPPPSQVIDSLDQLLAAPAAATVTPGQHNWRIFTELCRQSQASGNLVSEKFHAALAIEHRAVFVTLDHDFRQFEGLQVISPFHDRH